MSTATVELNNLIAGASRDQQSYASANRTAISNALDGWGPDSATASEHAGARMAVNISAVHIPAFCKSTNVEDKPYRNGYDLEKYRLGDNGKPVATRMIVDQALPIDTKHDFRDIYFGALEMNGTGVRFYGDLCMILRRGAFADDTVVLDRNSYDLVRPPLVDIVNQQTDENARNRERRSLAKKLSGKWIPDMSAMVGLRVFASIGIQRRRCTTGQIADAICNDEDYIEVLKIGSFGAAQLQEVRVSSNIAAADALAGDRVLTGPPPRFEALMWRERRVQAEAELRRLGVRFVTATVGGRTRD